jgi:uncharacterized membrane protein
MVGVMRATGELGRPWRSVLVVSLAVNLLLAGVIGAWLARPMFRGPPPRPEIARVIERVSNRLPENDAVVLRRAYESHRAELAQQIARVRDARAAVRRALLAEPLDPDALSAAMAEVHAAREEVEDVMQAVMRDAAVSMSPEGRRTLASGPRGEQW